jgi:energy-coupling factor transport system ATP-binding protein
LGHIKFLSFSYDYPNSARRALSDVTLEIPSGAFALVIGRSGSGKSTLLRCLNGLVPHFSGGRVSGSLRVDGLDPVREGPARMALSVGMVFQDPESQFVLDRVEDEIAFALENLAVPRDEMQRRVGEALRQMEIEPLRDRAISTLSGGEQQRVAIAAAIVLQPRILVLDEPTSQLDPESSDEVMALLTRLNRELGLTVVLAEHRLERVLPYVHEVMCVEDGQVVSGNPREVLALSELAPPVVELGKVLQLDPLPLSVEEARGVTGGLVLARPDNTTATSEGRRSMVIGAGGTERLRIDQLTVRYTDREAVSHASLVVNAGEVVALMGRNGAGKSTLLKSVVGLVTPDGGEVRVNGTSVAGRDTADICRDVAYLPQNPNALLFADTVADELRITLRNHQQDGAIGADARATALLERLGLLRYADAYPRDLSVGERERAALGAVTVTKPQLLLLDEPTRGLDYVAKRALTALLHGWARDGAGVLVVTHDVEFVAECADRVVLLSEGRVAADGSVAEVLGHSPVFTPQVAQVFPGSGWMTVEDVAHALSIAG